ncbi:MAG: AbrB/MazE/SpoVT family DNA-binding domain-containing protein [Clostridiales bacterium]|jgi:transcriptional pleiotropic regulator of transition state genes|nr:AbrB/MazE/SpoVT family DNA-binding domain-containing protein [Clostridiales bacterium]
MKSTGIVRKVDELGRIVLPIELRKTLLINDRDALEIFTNGDTVVLKKYIPSDIFTGDMDDLVEYKGLKVSLNSIRELARIAGYSLEKIPVDVE